LATSESMKSFVIERTVFFVLSCLLSVCIIGLLRPLSCWLHLSASESARMFRLNAADSLRNLYMTSSGCRTEFCETGAGHFD
jgi:hypothetical protein